MLFLPEWIKIVGQTEGYVIAGIKLVTFLIQNSLSVDQVFPCEWIGWSRCVSLVSTAHSEQSNQQHQSCVPAPAAVYLISECHSVISERGLPETFFQLVFNLLKRRLDTGPTNGADFISTSGEEGFTLWIKALASNHTDTLRAELKGSSVFGSLH